MAGGSDVFAVLGGAIVYSSPTSYTSGGTTVTYWQLRIGHDLDTARAGYELLSDYQHLDEATVPTALKSLGAPVSKGQFIGKISSTTGNRHLHIEFRSDTTNNYRLPQKLFWNNRSGSNSGNDADSIARPVDDIYGRISVVAYNKTPGNVTEKFALNAVTLHYRLFGTTTWYSKTMTPSADGLTFTATPHLSGDIEYYISAKRYPDDPNRANLISYRPAYWNQYQDAAGAWVSPPPPVYFYANIP